jgi:glycosyltransferase involved in cell wall biosynthesis
MAFDSDLRLSAIVCSHNGAETLPTALQSLRRQTLAESEMEVIVVDDGSSDETPEIALAAGVRVVRLDPSEGTARARNAGVLAARADVVAFIDDDCEADRDWANEIVRAFADPDLVGVGGKIVPDSPSGFVRRYLEHNNPLEPLGAELLESYTAGHRLRLYLRRMLLGPEEPGELYAAAGANLALRRAAVLEIGGFDEEIRFSPEDEDLCRRLHRRRDGAVLRFAATAVVTHHFDRRVRDIFRRARAYGQGTARLVRKYDEVKPIVFPVPAAAIAALAVGTLTRRTRLALAGVLLPLAGYPRWVAAVARQRSLEPVAYPYLTAAEEVCTMIGEWEELRRG